MSGVNISYEITSGGGEMKYETPLSAKESVHFAEVIAGEIVNEILESALDIATRASETGIHWKEIKESRTSMNPLNIPEKCIANEYEMNNICSNIVGDIVEKSGIPTPATITEIIDGLNSISVSKETDMYDEVPLDVEMKRLLAEMMSPPYEIISYNTTPAKRGVGDQPSEEIAQNLSINQLITEVIEVPRAVEKKSRVTDLVKNSPQIISEYLMMDERAKQNQEKWEEAEERVLQVIELDHVKPGEELYRVQKNIYPENVALPDDEDENDLISVPSNEDVMDIVDLNIRFKDGDDEQQAFNENSNGAKGDEPKSENLVLSGENQTTGEEISERLPRKMHENVKDAEQKMKKKKWNFGMRLWGFLKKGRNKAPQAQTSSTST